MSPINSDFASEFTFETPSDPVPDQPPALFTRFHPKTRP